ncbi:hypothetical protein QFC22_003595 [Naganishia vaughanmartiniae]|uniref:Uncharacterized protein n=1 Tax=Naganishia vaughanmartiniae TaxID=1424756 RepID=A0ACC2X6R8_9TREE|nr:hypothetical protein QFC22_003595 [Naganishia vaughanmartiniae]
MTEQGESPDLVKTVEEEDWERDETEEAVENKSTAAPEMRDEAITQEKSLVETASGDKEAEKDQRVYLQESSTMTLGKILPTPAIRLMQRPKEAPKEVRIPIAERSHAPVRSADPWDDEEWDSNRSGPAPNSKIWNEANKPVTADMPAIPQNMPALPSSAALRILRRPSPSMPGSSPASSGASTPAGSKTSGSSQNGGSKTLRTLSEREEEYKRARERIFGPDVDCNDVPVDGASDADGIATATSSPGSITKMLAAPETPTASKPTSSTASSVTSSTSASSTGVPRRQNPQLQQAPNTSRSASANSNGRSNRGMKRNGKGESTFEPLRPPREQQQIQYQQQQLLQQQQQQQQYYMHQQQYQIQLQLNGYAQSGYVGPAHAYGGGAGMNQGPGFVPYTPSQYVQNPMQAQSAAGSAMYPNRQTNPSMNPPNVLRQPAGPDDLSHGFADLRLRDQRYATGGPSVQSDATNGARMPGYNQYQNPTTGLHTGSTGLQDNATRISSAQPGYGTTVPPTQTGYNATPSYGARPTQQQQDSNLWPPLGNTSNGNTTPGSSTFIPRKGPQSVWRP